MSPIRPVYMFLDPRALFMLVVLVGVTGFVVKNVILSVYRLNSNSQSRGESDRMAEMEERLRKIEAATSSLLVDISSIKEKQRFMAKLQSGSTAKEPPAQTRPEGDTSPMVTQSIPIIPRVGTPRY
jgi:hypothetical protein